MKFWQVLHHLLSHLNSTPGSFVLVIENSTYRSACLDSLSGSTKVSIHSGEITRYCIHFEPDQPRRRASRFLVRVPISRWAPPAVALGKLPLVDRCASAWSMVFLFMSYSTSSLRPVFLFSTRFSALSFFLVWLKTPYSGINFGKLCPVIFSSWFEAQSKILSSLRASATRAWVLSLGPPPSLKVLRMLRRSNARGEPLSLSSLHSILPFFHQEMIIIAELQLTCSESHDTIEVTQDLLPAHQ